MVKKVINKIKSNKKFHLLYIGLFVLLGSMTLGYSALSTTLFLRGEATINKPEYLIAISSIKQGTATGGAYAVTKPSLENTEGSLNTKLPSNEAGLQYTLEIKNYGKTSTVLDYVFFSQSNPNVKFKLGGISIGDIITSGETRNVTITIEYWDDVTAPTEDTISTLFTLDFIKYESSYSNACTLNWDGSSVSQPTTRTVYDTTYYEINNANELAWFSNTINGGTNNINAILTNDICLNSKSFTQIGSSEKFTGIFDGQNRTIKDYYFTQEVKTKKDYEYYVGLFRDNYGMIRNTNLTVNVNDYVRYKPSTGNHDIDAVIGGLVAYNVGRIQNSSVSGQMNLTNILETNCTIARPEAYYYVGGVVGINHGVVTGSFNKVKLYSSSNLQRNACNYSKSKYLYMGGVAGLNYAKISDVYNTNTVESYITSNHKNTEYYGRIGGLVGQSQNGDVTSGVVKNGYNYGSIIHTKDNSNTDSNTVIDDKSGCDIGYNTGTVSNIYYDSTCSHGGVGTASSTADFKNPSLDVEYFLGNYFMVDTRGINNNYPILKWQ